jgi:hypothetical protein
MDDEEDAGRELHRRRRILDDVAQTAAAACAQLFAVQGEAEALRDDP